MDWALVEARYVQYIVAHTANGSVLQILTLPPSPFLSLPLPPPFLSSSFLSPFPPSFLFLQIISRALLESHEEALKAGQRLALEVFIAGRNRLENDGATALSQVFEVCEALKVTISDFIYLRATFGHFVNPSDTGNPRTCWNASERYSPRRNMRSSKIILQKS